MRTFILLATTISALCVPQLSATTIEPPEFEELVARSEQVFRGTVTATRCEWRGSGETRHIVTIVTVAISENVLGGQAGEAQLQFFGGKLDGESMEIVGQPRFKVGDDDILFVAGNGRTFCPLVAMGYGRYLVARNEAGRTFVARANGVPLISVNEVKLTLPEDAAGTVQSMQDGAGLAPEQFIEAIRERARALGRTDIVARP